MERRTDSLDLPSAVHTVHSMESKSRWQSDRRDTEHSIEDTSVDTGLFEIEMFGEERENL
jgi:hypothetical protein